MLFKSGWRIRITLVRIRIPLFTLMRIRIRLYTLMLMRIRILLLMKVMPIYVHRYRDSPQLQF